MSIDRLGWEELEIESRDGLCLPALRREAAAPKGVVVCLHGASAWGDTFRLPRGRSLSDALLDADYSVWLPEWRGSMRVVPHLGDHPSNMDIAARCDIPAIFAHVRQHTSPSKPIHVVAHCLGSAVLNMAIGGGHISRELLGTDAKVLCSTIGLFFSVPWDGHVKARDHLLERAVAADAQRVMNPGAAPGEEGAWMRTVEFAYGIWPNTLLPEQKEDDGPSRHFRRVSFMYGRPYLPDEVDDAIHRDELEGQFGAMDMGIYVHGTECIRRGYAVPTADAQGAVADPLTYLCRQRFAPFDLTYFGGAHNELWHRDSVDRMYEWLLRPGGPRRVKKRLFASFAHQDLYWGRRAAAEVFPFVLGELAGDQAEPPAPRAPVRSAP